MKADSDAMRLLTERLLGDGEAWFKAEELDVVLSWLSGSQRHGGDALASRIGAASEQPGRRIAVYDRLSAQLFRGEQLDLAGAHVDIDVDKEIRRGRYRRLMTAFHPDRFPEHADWLTSRSQAVLASYARFRKGEAPENRHPDPIAGHRPAPKRRPHQEWPRERRSARLTPMSGPGPLMRLRTWLLGIQNLQRRILVVLAVVCLVPVLYAYIAYKPYRDMPASEPASVARNSSSPPADPAEAADTAEAPIDEAHDADTGTSPALALSERETPAPVLPSWQQTRQAPQPAGARDAESKPVDKAAPAAQETAERDESGRNDKDDDAPDSNWMGHLADSAGESLAAVTNFIAAVETQQPPRSETGGPTDDSQRNRERELTSTAQPGGRDQTPNMARDRAEAAGARAQPDGEADPGGPPQAESAPEEPPANPAQEPQQVLAEARTSDPQPDADAPDEAASSVAGEAEAQAPAMVPEHPADTSDEPPHEHIEDLLAGYRTSFENGWLDEFLDHFTAEPRENAQRGRTWFRNNYGWLFDNTEGRRLDIDILDISRGDGHWVALARFDMKVDYPDRPATRSTRRVRYTIEANEHDQLRIAAIEY